MNGGLVISFDILDVVPDKIFTHLAFIYLYSIAITINFIRLRYLSAKYKIIENT
jgi:hypothetical protein